jgi:hypothetical protein
MKISTMRFLTLALFSVLVFPAAGFAAQTPRPKPRPLPSPHLPTTALHTEFQVEVNHMGQVVRVKSGKECPNPTFNAQTYGDVLQMFIRHPDGTATVGMYRISFDYNPKTQMVHRGVQLLSEGGDWADEQGAANQMMEQDAKNRAKHLALPGMDKILGRPVPKPSPTKH